MKTPLAFTLPALLLLLANCSTPEKPTAQVGAADAPAEAEPIIDQKNGFRSAHFGDAPLAGHRQLPVQNTPGLVFYERADEKLQLGDGRLQAVGYGFHQGQLARIVVMAPADNAAGLLAAATGLYGPPTGRDATGRVQVWQGQRVVGTYQAGSPQIPQARLVLSDVATDQQLAAEAAGGAQKSAADL